MRLLNKNQLVKFWRKHPDVRNWLQTWIDTVEAANWRNITEVRKTYPHADAVGTCTVFNVKGNRYRLITKINYNVQVVAVIDVYTHSEYDKEGWKNDCKAE